MNQNNASRSAPGLKDELARLCLPEANRDPDRLLAWVNSVCLIFLLIGLVGARRGFIVNRPVPPIEEAIPVITEPVVVPPQAATEQKKEQTDQSAEPTPVAVVIPQAPNINFSVPTIGGVLVPNSLAAAPTAEPTASLAKIFNVSDTGLSGDRPMPPYPPIAAADGEQGTVGLSMVGDAAGNIISVSLKTSSGFSVLDHAALEFVRRHWHLPAGDANRPCECNLIYQLQPN